MERQLTMMEYSILKAAEAGSVWVSFTKADEMGKAQKLADENLLRVNRAESSTSGIAYDITDQGREALRQGEQAYIQGG
jgi:hypothetical protein